MEDVEFFLMKAILYVMNRLACLLVLFVAMVMAGCSVITRPPSAAAFMNSYRDESVTDVNFAMYGGDLVLNEPKRTDYLPKKYDKVESSEWFADLSLIHYINKFHFTVGLGFQSLTPIWQPGFVSRNFGVMAWSNLLPLSNRIDDGSGKTDGVGLTGGISAIEQLVVGDKIRIGITEHISKNGRESYWNEDECYGAFGPRRCIGEAKSVLYTEIGVGVYFTYRMISLEFRYGRDVTEKRNRFTFSFDYMFFSKEQSE